MTEVLLLSWQLTSQIHLVFSPFTIPWTLLVSFIFMMSSPFSLPFCFRSLGFVLPCCLRLSPSCQILLCTPVSSFYCTGSSVCALVLVALHHMEQLCKAPGRPDGLPCIPVSPYWQLLCPVSPTSVSPVGWGPWSLPNQHITHLQVTLHWRSSEQEKNATPMELKFIYFFPSSVLSAVNHYKISIQLRSFTRLFIT